MATSREELVPKKGTVSSIIWNWFGFVASDAEQTTPLCKVCLMYVASKGSSTTNLLQHLKQRHAQSPHYVPYEMNKTAAAQAHLPKNNLQSYKHLQTVSGMIRTGPGGKRSLMQSQCILQKIWCPYILWKSRGLFTCWKFWTPDMCYQAANIFLKLACLSYITVHAKGSLGNWKGCRFTQKGSHHFMFYVMLNFMLCYVTLRYVTFSLFTVAGPAILSFLLVVSDCTLTPRGKSKSNPIRENQNKINLKLVLNNFFVICRLILSRGDKIDLNRKSDFLWKNQGFFF